MLSEQVRSTFLGYFRGQDHTVLSSSSVIPQGDKTLLFTNAGMVQFKDVFTGREKARAPRATTVQKCIRAGGKHNDLDNVGYTKRHLTFFEMLGNFSFGDYFKKEAIAYAWELVTKGFGIDRDRLWITVYREDDEARKIWRQVSGLPESRIVGLGDADNFWSMGDVGPCGPCSEILFDRGEAFGSGGLENGERFFEIWNLVFMQLNQAADGCRSPLPKPSIDTGMGLERMAMVLQGVDSVFETDVLRAIIRRVEELTSVAFESGPAGVPHRVLADHVRSLAFAIADGERPSNSTRGYVVRRMLRRAARYGRKIHTADPILHLLVPTLVREMGKAYPELVREEETISRCVRSEEELFGKTLDRGLEIFDEVAGRLRAKGSKVVTGKDLHLLYTTYGFPADLVERMALELGFSVDMTEFSSLMEKEREISQAGEGAFAASARVDDGAFDALPVTSFLGYEKTSAEAEILGAAESQGRWRLVLSQSPFYGESGGQVGDTGVIEGPSFRFVVSDTQKESGKLIHLCSLAEGDPGRVRPGAVINAAVDVDRRRDIERNHTATHLLHAALRSVLGAHVQQKGSLVDPRRLRFDVSHFSAVSQQEMERVQAMVQEVVRGDLPVECEEMPRVQALALGAMAFFEEKYGDRVRVVRVGEFSMELCGGTHVRRTGEVGSFALVHEGSVSSGVRRLEALTAAEAERLFVESSRLIADLARVMKVPPAQLRERVERLVEENRELKASRVKGAASGAAARGLVKRSIGDVLVVHGILEGLDGKALLSAYDAVKQDAKKLLAVLISRAEAGKVQVLVAVSPSLVSGGLKARDVFAAGAEILQARGGGRDEMAQGSGSKPENAGAAIEAMLASAERSLSGSGAGGR